MILNFLRILHTTISLIAKTFVQLMEHNEDFLLIYERRKLKEWHVEYLLQYLKDIQSN